MLISVEDGFFNLCKFVRLEPKRHLPTFSYTPTLIIRSSVAIPHSLNCEGLLLSHAKLCAIALRYVVPSSLSGFTFLHSLLPGFDRAIAQIAHVLTLVNRR